MESFLDYFKVMRVNFGKEEISLKSQSDLANCTCACERVKNNISSVRIERDNVFT